MAGLFKIDPEFEEKLKGAKKVWTGIKGKAASGLEAIHAQGKPTGPVRQRMLSPKKKDISKPGGVGAGSAPSVLATKNARQNIAPVNKNIADPLAYESTPERRVPTPSFDARDTIPRSTIFTKARENIQRQFGPERNVGGRDVYDKEGNIMESSTWLPEGKAYSSNAWEKTVGGQPNVRNRKNWK